MPSKTFERINKGIKQPELVALESGFLTSPGTNTSNLSIDELFLFIHPFNSQIYLNDEKNPNYTNRRDNLIRNYELPILIGFEHIRLPISADWLQGLQPQGARIIYQTDYFNPRPILPRKEDFINKLRDLFNPSSIRLGGAVLRLNKNGEPDGERGCVNDVYRFLSPYFKVRIDREYCWKD